MTIYICGDSTAASYPPEQAPMTGWGQVLGEFLPGIRIENRAMAGRSTKSFLAEGRLKRIEEELLPGDVLLIQFTHNDLSDREERHTDPWTTFRANLDVFIDTALRHGARPVLLTPICRQKWENGQLVHLHGEYPEVIRTAARERGISLIDMEKASEDIVRALGEKESAKLYMNLEAGVWPAYPEGRKDDAHTCRAGAEAYARIAAEGLRRLGIPE